MKIEFKNMKVDRFEINNHEILSMVTDKSATNGKLRFTHEVLVNYDITADEFQMFHIGTSEYELQDLEFRNEYPDFVNEVLAYVKAKGEF